MSFFKFYLEIGPTMPFIRVPNYIEYGFKFVKKLKFEEHSEPWASM